MINTVFGPPPQKVGWLVEWGFYALSASKAIFRARTYNCNLFSPVMMITWWMKLGGNRPPGDNPLLFSTSGTGSFICPVADEAGHTKAFDDPVAEHWGESQRAKRSLVGLEPTSAHTYEPEIQRSTTYATPTSPPPPQKKCPKHVIISSFPCQLNPVSSEH